MEMCGKAWKKSVEKKRGNPAELYGNIVPILLGNSTEKKMKKFCGILRKFLGRAEYVLIFCLQINPGLVLDL